MYFQFYISLSESLFPCSSLSDVQQIFPPLVLVAEDWPPPSHQAMSIISQRFSCSLSFLIPADSPHILPGCLFRNRSLPPRISSGISLTFGAFFLAAVSALHHALGSQPTVMIFRAGPCSPPPFLFPLPPSCYSRGPKRTLKAAPTTPFYDVHFKPLSFLRPFLIPLLF